MAISKLVVSWIGNFHVVEAVEAVEAVETLVGGGQCPILIADTDHLTKLMSLLMNRANTPKAHKISFGSEWPPFYAEPSGDAPPILVFFKSRGAEMFFAPEESHAWLIITC